MYVLNLNKELKIKAFSYHLEHTYTIIYLYNVHKFFPIKQELLEYISFV